MSLPPLAPVPLIAIAENRALLDGVDAEARFLVVDAASFAQHDDFGVITTDIHEVPPAAPPAQSRLVAFPLIVSRRVTLGRSSARSDILVRHPSVSGAHAAIVPDGGKSWLVDLSSSNGTFLDGRCLAPGDAGRVPLQIGASISLARIELRFLGRAMLVELVGARFGVDTTTAHSS